MNTYALALVFGALAIPALGGMWFAWRARARRDAALLDEAPVPAGELIASFSGAGYVSTTLADAPLERVALPGLRYKGDADVEVHRDGVVISVTGERPVGIAAGRIIGSGTTNARIGKAVERDGLSLLRWRTGPVASAGGGADARDVESSFRFRDPTEQRRFATAVAAVADLTSPATHHDTTQEDA